MKNAAKKVLSVFTAVLVLAAALALPAYANSTTSLQITSSQVMEIDGANANQINYYTDARQPRWGQFRLNCKTARTL